MSSLDAALRRLNVAIDQLDARLARPSAMNGGEDPRLRTELDRLSADRDRLAGELAAMRNEERAWTSRAAHAATQVDAAIQEIKSVLEA